MWKRIFTIFTIALLTQHISYAAKPALNINITSEHNKWEVNAGVMTGFVITVVDSNNLSIKNVKLNYEIGPEMVTPYIKDSATAFNGKFTTPSYTLYHPGFLRCVVTITMKNIIYKKVHTVGYDVDKIMPTVAEPCDFDAFWQNSMKDLAKIPMDANMKLLPQKSSATVDVFHVSVKNINNSRIYGMLAIPKKAGKYPVVLQVPGAGVRSYNPDTLLAEKGLIVFTIGIHGIEVNLDSAIYRDLGAGALSGYFYFNLQDRDKYYYKRVYLGCVRAVDFLSSLKEFDGKNLILYGGSQGGALSIVTSALDSRVTGLVSFYPALCDLTGYVYNRAGGWPHVFANENFIRFYNKENAQALSYYDVVNFAKRVRQAGFYTWGYNDVVCPPTSIYAAYNKINAPKKLSLFYETGHWSSPEQKNESVKWILSHLK